jgi:hypothetical protein
MGLRLAYLRVGDDRGSITEEFIRPLEERDEYGLVMLLGGGPWRGLSADAEHVWWNLVRVQEAGTWLNGVGTHREETDRRAFRGGVRGSWSLRRAALWCRVHRIWIEPGYEALYRALTYDANQSGWRVALGGEIRSFPTGRPRLAVSGFARVTEEVEETLPEFGPIEKKIYSVSVTASPQRDLRTGVHVVHTVTETPHPAIPDDKTTGTSLDLIWKRWPSVEPNLRIDVLRRDDGSSKWTLWQGYLFVRILA